MRESLAVIPPAPVFVAEEIGRHCLVTGGAGYVGRALVRRLSEAGCKVRSLDVLVHSHGEGVETVAADLRNAGAVRKACEGIDTVFHTAAIINTLSLYRPSVRKFVFDVNVGGTRNLVNAATDSGVSALVHTSSFNVAMDGRVTQQDESMPYATGARDLYSRTKIEAERIVREADGRAGLRSCALRPGGIWGCDAGSMMIRGFVEQLAAGKFKVLVGDPKTVTDNTHIDNLVDAELLAARALQQKPALVGGQAFNITDDEPLNAMEWFRPLVEGLGYPFPQRWLPMGLMRGIALAAETVQFLGGPPTLLTLRGINNLAENSHLSIARARRDLDYRPRVRLANGIPLLLPEARQFIAGLRAGGAGH